MSEFLSTAFIQIRAELAKGFRADLREKVKRSIGTGFFVPVKPALGAFRADLQREFKKTPFLVNVMPNIDEAKFRASLQKQVNKAAAGVTATVQVRGTGGFFQPPGGVAGAAGRGAGTGGGGGGGTSGRKKEEEELTGLLARRAKAQALLTEANAAGLTVEQRLRTLSLARQEAERGLKEAITGSTGVSKAEFRALSDTAAQRGKNLKNLRNEEVFRKELDALRTQANKGLQTEISSITRRGTLAELNNKLLATEAELKALGDRATRAGVKGIETDTNALRRNIQARQADIVSRREQIRTEAVQASRQRQAARGVAATGLSFAGLRGATLAAGGPFLAGAAAVAVSAKAIQSAAQLQSELNVLRITAKATEEQMRAVREESVALGRDLQLPGVAATDATQAIQQLVRAGLDVEDAIDGARGVLQLGIAAQIDFADATDLVASALNAFKLSGADATLVADLFTNAANESQASIEDMAISLRQSAAAAAITGVSLEDTVALLTILARAGLTGSDAGTSLRVALLKLVNPTKEANKVLEQLNINLRDSQGNIRPEVFAEFTEATQRLTRAQRQQAAAVVFGSDAFRTISLVGREGIQGLDNTRLALDRVGSASEIANARAVGLTGALEGLKNAMSTLGTSVGGFTLGPLTSLVSTMARVATKTNEAIDAMKRFEDAIPQPKGAGGKLGIFSSLPDQLDEFTAALDLISRGKLIKFGEEPSVTLAKLNAEAKTTKALVGDVEIEVNKLFATFRQSKQGPTAVNELVLGLDAMADKLADGDVEAQKVARSIRAIIKEIQDAGTLPPTIVSFETRLDKNQARREAKTASETILESLRTSAPEFADVGLFLIQSLGAGMQKGVDTLTFDTKKFTQSLTTKLAVAQATGTDSEVLRILRAQEARQLDFLTRLQSRPQDPKTQALVQKAAANLEQTRNQIQSILDEQTRATEQAAKDAEQKAKDLADARERLDQAILGRLERVRGRAEGRLEIAQQTEGVEDDIRRTIAIRKLVHKQINVIKDRIKTLTIQRDAIRELQKIEFGLKLDIAKLRAERAASIRDEIRRGIELDIEFATITENRPREISARRRFIASLEKEASELRKQKRLTIEQKNRLKEIRNEIAEQRKALQDITQERKKMFAEMSFAFLTTQQGFAANLLGNLLPMGAIGGTLGGTTNPLGTQGSSTSRSTPLAILRAEQMDRTNAAGRVSGRMAESARMAQAGEQGGFTNAQATTLIFLTRRIVQLLGGIEGTTKHPESRRSSARNNAAQDGISGVQA